MTVLDLWIPDDLPLTAERDLGQALAAAVDRTVAGETLVWVHRLPSYGVISAGSEGVRAIRVRSSTPGLVSVLEEVVRDYAGGLAGKPIEVRIDAD